MKAQADLPVQAGFMRDAVTDDARGFAISLLYQPILLGVLYLEILT